MPLHKKIVFSEVKFQKLPRNDIPIEVQAKELHQDYFQQSNFSEFQEKATPLLTM